jgi:hypothetical protein
VSAKSGFLEDICIAGSSGFDPEVLEREEMHWSIEDHGTGSEHQTFKLSTENAQGKWKAYDRRATHVADGSIVYLPAERGVMNLDGWVGVGARRKERRGQCSDAK